MDNTGFDTKLKTINRVTSNKTKYTENGKTPIAQTTI